MRPDVSRSVLLVLGVFSTLRALGLVLLAEAIARGVVGAIEGADVAPAVALACAAGILRAVASWATQVFAARAAIAAKSELRLALADRVLAGPVGSVGAVTSVGSVGLDELDNYYRSVVPALTSAAAIPLLVGARILSADWLSALIVVLTVPLVPLFMTLVGMHTRERADAASATLARLSDHLVELARGLPVLVGLGRVEEQTAALTRISSSHRATTMQTLRSAFLSSLVLELLSTISVAIVAVAVGIRLVHGDMSLEVGLVALVLAPECFAPFRDLGSAFHASQDGLAAKARARAIIDAPIAGAAPADGAGAAVGASGAAALTVTEDARGESAPNRQRHAASLLPNRHAARPESTARPEYAARPESAARPEYAARPESAAPGAATGAAPGGLRVDGLTVRFADRDADVFTDLSFDVRERSTVVIEGPSGAGKSTLLSVLAGSREGVAAGIVSGASATAWVPQHPHTVGSTVRAELALYAAAQGIAANGTHPLSVERQAAKTPDSTRPDGDAEAETADASAGSLAIERVAASVGLSAVLDSDPAQLSPGELRRVAVARGLLRVEAGATLLLLDEPTAHLDPASAELVIGAIRGIQSRVTIVLASHDAGVAELADHRVILGLSEFRAADAPAALTQQKQQTADVATTGRALPELLAFLAPVRGRFAAAIALGSGAALFAMALTAVSAWLIVRASEQPPIMYLLVAIVGVRFFGLGRSGLRYAERLLTHDAVLGSLVILRTRLWRGLASRGVASRKLATGGVALDYLVASADRVRDLVARVLVPIGVGLVCALAVVITVLVIFAPAVPVILAVIVVGLVVAPAIALIADRAAASGQAAVRSSVVRTLAAIVAAAFELRANGVGGAAGSLLRSLDSGAGELARRSARALGAGAAASVLACCIGAGAMIAVGATSGIEPGLIAVLVLLPVALIEPLVALVDAVQHAPALVSALRKVNAVAGYAPAPATITGRVDSLELTDVAIAWPGASPVFSGVTASVARGEWLVIEGPSGSGKSTLLSALLGYLTPTSGTVDFVAPTALPVPGALAEPAEEGTLPAPAVQPSPGALPEPTELRRATPAIAWCPQEGHLFDSTLRANLLLARPRDDKPTDAEMIASLDRVGLSSLLESLPLGLDTRLGSEGANLSGGQRQRVAVARTLLSRADVILLDEPTAHLDAASAANLMTDLRAALADRIVVLVTHHADEAVPADARIRLGAVREFAAR